MKIQKPARVMAVLLAIVILVLGVSMLYSPALISGTQNIDDINYPPGDPSRGEYVLRMAGCVACHTDLKNDGAFLAGGAPLETPFGIFYPPNITPSTTAGIGGWTTEQFGAALTHGISPKGEHYYPAFPYTSYSRMSRQDISDLKAYIDTLEASSKPSRTHELGWPFSERRLLAVWKWINFSPTKSDDQDGQKNTDRGAYLVGGPGHCAECHSERNLLGGLDEDRNLLGTQNGPDNLPVPAIRGAETDIASWEKADLVFYLQTGITPDGDAAGGAMSEVIHESTSYLNDDDIEAIAQYLLREN